MIDESATLSIVLSVLPLQRLTDHLLQGRRKKVGTETIAMWEPERNGWFREAVEKSFVPSRQSRLFHAVRAVSWLRKLHSNREFCQ